MISICYDGKVWDYSYTKHPQGDGWYTFYLRSREGQLNVGTVIKKTYGASKGSWSCFSNKCTLVHGFATRYDACVFLLRVEGYYDEKIFREIVL